MSQKQQLTEVIEKAKHRLGHYKANDPLDAYELEQALDDVWEAIQQLAEAVLNG